MKLHGNIHLIQSHLVQDITNFAVAQLLCEILIESFSLYFLRAVYQENLISESIKPKFHLIVPEEV